MDVDKPDLVLIYKTVNDVVELHDTNQKVTTIECVATFFKTSTGETNRI